MPILRAASLAYAARRATGRQRRVWSREGRSHIEHRAVDGPRLADYLAAAVDRLEADADVNWAQVDLASRRLVVDYDPIWLTESDLVAIVEQVERDLGIDDVDFPDDRADHPGDTEPIYRDAIQVAADVTAIGVAAVTRVTRFLPRPRGLELGWVVGVAENFPRVRTALEGQLGADATDVVLGLTNSTLQGLTANLTSPLVDLTHRVSQVGAHLARRTAFEEVEPRLHPGPDVEAPPLDEEVIAAARPVPVPEGEVERYSEESWFASVGGLLSSLAATNDIDRAATPIVDAMPKAARLGREAFCAALERLLAQRRVVVRRPDVIRLFDRLDTVVLDRALVLDGDEPVAGARELIAAARRSDLTIAVTDVSARLRDHLGVDRSVDGDDIAGVIRQLQQEGHVVAYVAAGASRGFSAADVGIGVLRAGEPTPQRAHIITGDDLADAYLLLDAARLARRISHQSVRFALAGAGVGAASAMTGLSRRTRDRVVRVVDGASLLAIGNGLRAVNELVDTPTRLVRETRPWHAMTGDEVLEEVGSHPDGLEATEARRRLEQPPEPPGDAELLRRSVVEELRNPLTPVLAAGAGVSAATGGLTDAALIAGVVGLNALVGGAQRFRTERAVAQLDQVSEQEVRVRRDGALVRISSAELVVGDIVELQAGESVPADCRILEANNLEVDESALTGESLPVAKSAEPSDEPAVADRTSMLYDATSIAAGTAVAVVVATGRETEARWALSHRGSDKGRDTGVEARLQELSNLTVPLALGSGLGTAAIGFVRRLPTREILDASIGLAVAAVPEGLPLLATVAQLAAARRLSSKDVLVRNPRAVEALGRVDVVCADKTGTLTEGRLQLTTISDGRTARHVDDLDSSHDRVMLAARRSTPIEPGERLPHPTDQAIAVGTGEAGVGRGAGGAFEVLDDLPFEPGRSYHAVLATTDEGPVLAAKGAPEVILDRCRVWIDPAGDEQELTAELRGELEEAAEDLAVSGYRVLAVAERAHHGGERISDDDVRDLVLLGFLGLADPVRPVAAESIERLRSAGVDVIMITGDHPSTARGIAAELGLDDGIIITGPELDDLDEDALDDVMPKVTVFARVTPAHKVRIVRALQRVGRTVAMTGDGANDAPAIRLADVGIALGKRATPAARDAADLIITKERLEVIVDAIAEGRGLWGSVRDAVAVLVGGNVGEITFTFLGTVLGRRPPLNARQLLLVNLLTDVAPAMAIAVRPPGEHAEVDELLHEGPETSLGGELNRAIGWRAAGTTVGATYAYSAARVTGSVGRARTVGLLALVGSQLGQTVATGLDDPRILATGIGSALALVTVVQTPGLSGFVGCRPVGPVGWGIGVTGAAIGTTVGMVGPVVDRLIRGEPQQADVEVDGDADAAGDHEERDAVAAPA